MIDTKPQDDPEADECRDPYDAEPEWALQWPASAPFTAHLDDLRTKCREPRKSRPTVNLAPLGLFLAAGLGWAVLYYVIKGFALLAGWLRLKGWV